MKNVLFLCVANSARSQMAEALARAILPKDYKIQSAGSKPSFVHPMAIRVMKECDIEMESHRSKSVDEINASEVDLVITLCAEEVCPTVLGQAKKLSWTFSDPAHPDQSEEQMLNSFRTVRDALRQKLSSL